MVDMTLPTTMIKHRGFFDYSKVLQATRQWFIDDDYDILDIPSYKQKFPTPTGVEHEMKINAEKNVTEYVKFRMNIFMRVYNMREIEIIQDGKKIKLQDGQILFNITPTLILDWQNRFTGPEPWKNFLEALDNFYRNYIIKYKIADYWEDTILLKSGQLASVIKEALGQEVM